MNPSPETVRDRPNLSETVQKLYHVWEETRLRSDRVAIVNAMVPQIKKWAQRVHRKTLGHGTDVGDFISEGGLAAFESVENYRPGAATFLTYVRFRVIGAMLDYARRTGWVTRNDITAAKRYRTVYEQLQNTLHREPTDEEIAEKCGVSLRRVSSWRQAAERHPMQSLSLTFSGDSKDPITEPAVPTRPTTDSMSQLETRDYFCQVRKLLDKREGDILWYYYVEDLTLQEIANRLNVTESRICQIVKRVYAKLKDRLPPHIASTFHIRPSLELPKTPLPDTTDAVRDYLVEPKQILQETQPVEDTTDSVNDYVVEPEQILQETQPVTNTTMTKDRQVGFHISHAEFESLDQQCRELNISRSDWFRAAIAQGIHDVPRIPNATESQPATSRRVVKSTDDEPIPPSDSYVKLPLLFPRRPRGWVVCPSDMTASEISIVEAAVAYIKAIASAALEPDTRSAETSESDPDVTANH